MRLILFVRTALCCILLPSLSSPASAQTSDYPRIHREATVVDGHNDVLGRVVSGDRIDIRGVKGHSDLPRFREGGVDVQVFSVWVHPKKGTTEGWKEALRQIDSLHALANRSGGALCVCGSGNDADAALRAGALAGIISIEGSTSIDGKPERIRALHVRGLRMLAPTWNRSVGWASSSEDEAAGKGKGLTAHGRRLVRLLDTLGILIDISHLGPKSIADAIQESRNPVIASHSSCASLRAHHRNLTDEQLRSVAATGGVVMINFFPPFIRAGMSKKKIEQTRAQCQRLNALAIKYPKRIGRFLTDFDAIIRQAAKQGLPTLIDVADHIDHAVRVAGAAHVGLGSDFDGISYARPAGRLYRTNTARVACPPAPIMRMKYIPGCKRNADGTMRNTPSAPASHLPAAPPPRGPTHRTARCAHIRRGARKCRCALRHDRHRLRPDGTHPVETPGRASPHIQQAGYFIRHRHILRQIRCLAGNGESCAV
jgi:membrane dipeptidase